jgi:hypothetical protein
VEEMMREFQKALSEKDKEFMVRMAQEDGEKKAEDEPRNDEK